MTGSNDSKSLTEADSYDVQDYSAHTHTHVKDEMERKGAYYDETVPRNDPKFLLPIRTWEKRMGFETAIIWRNVFFLTSLHLLAIVGPLLCLQKASLKIVLFSYLVGNIGGFGVTAGAHRCWSHRSYKAKLPLQLILLFCFATAGQNKIFDWVRDHRVHHKCSETSADPHNALRGFFFSHVGWLMMKKHPHVIQEGRKIYLDDIRNDTLITIYTRYFAILQMICCIILPTVAPVYLWGEDWAMSFFANITRYTLNLNCTWAVNSFAHLWGNKPYNPFIMPVENWAVSIVAMGEGWHNYHHTFPWDYKTAELAYFINITTLALDAFAKIGWVYDRKQASQGQIQYVIDKQIQMGQTSCISKNKNE